MAPSILRGVGQTRRARHGKCQAQDTPRCSHINATGNEAVSASTNANATSGDRCSPSRRRPWLKGAEHAPSSAREFQRKDWRSSRSHALAPGFFPDSAIQRYSSPCGSDSRIDAEQGRPSTKPFRRGSKNLLLSSGTSCPNDPRLPEGPVKLQRGFDGNLTVISEVDSPLAQLPSPTYWTSIHRFPNIRRSSASSHGGGEFC